uniref:Actin-like protein arp6 n=1 Tax=Arundo donax TaxID=35708 RepID=A0A0A9DNP1_ARUDO
MDLGGKALTNYLKELISYRSLNVMDETLLIDDAKEKLCFVSLDVPRDLHLARSAAFLFGRGCIISSLLIFVCLGFLFCVGNLTRFADIFS